jgi:FkbM family methyltransferase
MSSCMFENLKQTLRRVEARFTPRRSELTFREWRFSVVRSLWWDDATQASFEAEIIPYFKTLNERARFASIVDAGAATGFFSISAGLLFPGARIFAFEPSPRQRIVLKRNLAKSDLADRVQIEGIGLWNKADRLSFRTHGAMSSFESVSELRGKMPFQESVEVKALDRWAEENKLPSLDLVKMDIEGAEIEALEGAVNTLQRFRPELLVQAYHLREGGRTYERCEQILSALGYQCREIGKGSGFLHAQYRG